jgi:hypothetical protein
MNMSHGIAMLGAEGIATGKAKILQLHEMKVMIAWHHFYLRPKQKNAAQAYLMCLKRKHCAKSTG